MQSKLFAKSLTLWGALIAFFCSEVYRRTGVNVSDQVEPLQKAIQAIINDLPPLASDIGVFAGVIASIVGRFRSRQPLHLVPGAQTSTLPISPLTKVSVAAAAACFLALGLTACTTTGTAPSPAASGGSSAASVIEANLPIIRTSAAVTTGIVLNFTVTDSARRATLANKIYSAANAVYSLAGGTFPTPTQVSSTILAFGGSQADASYSQFATAVGAIYSAYYPKLVTGDTRTATDLLEAIAGGMEDATASYISTSPAAN